ncbi:MAG: lipid A biosynthesis acyltransferase [Bacteroidetes bacterium]|nr:MAG: lipid A biosynthesis acyltransferase [Bacteroidota bacterium]
MNRFYYYLFLFFLLLFKNTSFWFLYRVSDLFYFFLFYVLKYRRKVVTTNLRESFPDKPDGEIRQIARGYYKHLCDISVEGVKAFSLRRKDIQKRYKLLNPEILDPTYQRKQSVMAVLGHYNNWEWGSLAAGIFFRHKPVGFYKPLHNQFIDNYIQKTRAKEGMVLESVSHTSQTFRRLKKSPSIYIMVADQSPMNLKLAYWVPFLNRETAVLHGTEKHAILNNYPVYFADVQKVKRGFYTVTLELLVANPKEAVPGEITQLFMQRLEQQIRAKPEYWLWSHRRWKHSRT